MSKADVPKYEEALAYFKAMPHYWDVIDGKVKEDLQLSPGQKAILSPLLAAAVGDLINELDGEDATVDVEKSRNIFGFLNKNFTWQERVGFTHIVGRVLRISLSRFAACDEFTKFAETTSPYLRGSI